MKELETILESKSLDLKQKQRMLNKLRKIVFVDSSTGDITLNNYIIFEIHQLLAKHDPLLFTRVRSKIITSKSWRQLHKQILVDSDIFLLLIFTIIVGVSLKRGNVPETILKINVLNLVSEFFMSDSTGYVVKDFESKLNQALNNSIATRRIDSIGIRGLDKHEKQIWRCLDIVIKELIRTNWLKLDKEYTTLENPLSDNPTVKTRPHPINILSLQQVLPLTSAIGTFSASWPKLEPIEISKDLDIIHDPFRHGESRLVSATDDLKLVLQKVHEIGFKYDYPLYQEALQSIKSDVTLTVEREFTFEALFKKKMEIELSLYAIQQSISQNLGLEKHSLNCFLIYVKKYDLRLRIWFLELRSKVEKKVKYKKYTPSFLFYQYQYEPYDSSYDEILLKILNFIVEELERKNYDWVSILKLLYAKNYSEDHTVKKLLILSVLENLTLSQIANFKIIFDCFLQKKYPFLTLWNDYYIHDLKSRDSQLYNQLKAKDQAKRALTNNTILKALKLNLNFKSQTFKMFQNYYVYFTPYIAVNGRLTYKSFLAHPHSGDLFRFAKIKKKFITKRGLLHLKRALCSSLKIKFNTLKEYDRWGDQIDIQELTKYKNQSLAAFCYIDAYQNILKNKPCDTAIRVDQTASALAIVGILTNDSYLKEITNLKGGDIYNSPYEQIAKTHIKPIMEDLLNSWNNDPLIRSDKQKAIILKSVEAVVYPAITRKKFVKYLIMPHLYNLTHKGVKDKIIELLKQEIPDEPWNILSKDPMILQLSLKLWHSVFKASPKMKRLRDILNKTYTAIHDFISSNKEEESVWFSNVIQHHDCVIKWEYLDEYYLEKKVWDPELQYSKPIKLSVHNTKSDYKRNQRSFLPLFIQSIDGAIIRMTIKVCVQKYGFTPITIHDCASTHPNDIDSLLEALKVSFVKVFGDGELTNKVFIEKVWLNPTLEELNTKLPEKCKEKIKDIWEKEWDANSKSNKKYEFKETLLDPKCIFDSEFHYFYE